MAIALASPSLVHCVVSTAQPPCWPPPRTPPRPMMEAMLMLNLGPRRQRKLHQMSDALLSTPAMWILHDGALSICVLIHKCLEALALLVLRFDRLRVSRTRRGTGADGTLATLVREELLCLRGCWGCLGRVAGFGARWEGFGGYGWWRVGHCEVAGTAEWCRRGMVSAGVADADVDVPSYGLE